MTKNVKVDVAIIGGGLAGIMCAESIHKLGKKVCILEAEQICSGETLNSSAMITFAHDIIYSRLIKKHSFETAKQYYELAKYGTNKIEEIIKEYNINCDYTKCNMYLFSTTKKGSKEIVKEYHSYKSLGENVDLTYLTELPLTVINAIKIENQAYLNPFKFTSNLCKALIASGVEVYEHTRILSPPQNNILKVGEYTVEADNFIIASHFPFINFPGLYFTKMFQSRSHNVIYKNNLHLENMYESAEDNGFEFRPLGEYTLCGGASIRTGKYKYKSQYEIVKKYLTETISIKPESIIGEFSAQDCITFDMLPFVGSYSKFIDNLFVVTGFNKWGFSTSAAAAKIICDQIYGKKEDNIFNPSRIYSLNVPAKEIKNISNVISDYAQLIISTDAKKINRLMPGQGAVIKQSGERLGVYKHENGDLDIISAICPHLGCSLKWNKDELSWDCPCHGSRFDIKGNILSSPTVKNARHHSVKKT